DDLAILGRGPPASIPARRRTHAAANRLPRGAPATGRSAPPCCLGAAGLPHAQLGRQRLDLAPGLVLDGDAVAAALRLEPRLGLAGDQDLAAAGHARR